MSPATPPRLAARRVIRVEARLGAPFTAIGRVETRAAALATTAGLAIVGIASSLVAVFHLGDLLALSTAGRTALIATTIAWIATTDAVEPLGLRMRDLAGSLAGEADTYRPVAAAWLSVVRAGAFVTAVAVAALLGPTSVPLAAAVALLALGFVASQAESVARRRAWSLGDSAADRSSGGRSIGRDEELVHALTGGPTDSSENRTG